MEFSLVLNIFPFPSELMSLSRFVESVEEACPYPVLLSSND
jgi:hypothetical protein